MKHATVTIKSFSNKEPFYIVSYRQTAKQTDTEKGGRRESELRKKGEEKNQK